MPTPNEDLAAGCGQDANCKEPIQAVPGTYECPVTKLREGSSLTPASPPACPNPFGSLSGK